MNDEADAVKLTARQAAAQRRKSKRVLEEVAAHKAATLVFGDAVPYIVKEEGDEPSAVVQFVEGGSIMLLGGRVVKPVQLDLDARYKPTVVYRINEAAYSPERVASEFAKTWSPARTVEHAAGYGMCMLFQLSGGTHWYWVLYVQGQFTDGHALYEVVRL